MEYEHAYSTTGSFKGQDLTFLEFSHDEVQYRRYFTETIIALCELDPTLEFREYDDRTIYINRFLTKAEIDELTGGCPSRDYLARSKPRTAVNPQYL